MTTDTLDKLRDELLGAVAAAADPDALEDIRVRALGRAGIITEQLKGLGAAAPEDRRALGQGLNALKNTVADAIAARKEVLDTAGLDARLATETIDVTLPSRPEASGRIHPISQTIDEMVAIFCEMGFSVAEGPHIETDFHNFTALNI
ncbi:MAG: phenylalanyl-tRNA synthetase alpha chain, partial [Alphaproteobacteria bacterium]